MTSAHITGDPGTDTKADSANLTREDARQRAQIITRVESYRVDLDVATGSAETFTARTTITFSATPGATTFADVQALSIERAVLNGQEISTEEFDGNRLPLPALAQSNELTVESTMRYSHTGEGLHRLVDPVDQEVYLYSQFEVADARRMYTTFEQPDLKASFTFSVIAPKDWLVLSNSPTPQPVAVEGREDVARWDFPPTGRISTYLTALVAGPYRGETGELTSSDGRTIPLGVYCRASLAEHLDAQEIMDITRQGFTFYEREFETPYPFEKYDQIFVPDFNFGAMENVGCVTFRDSYVFRSKVTGAMEERRAVTILHELAHMWFGDLVTMRWWNDLWLNESFAEYMSTLATAEATRWDDAWVTFTAMEKAWAYRQDQLPSTHPIVAPVRDFEDVFTNFDGITYAKGASVLTQLVAYVGRENFFAGLRQYFTTHAWSNTELADLMTELEAASGRDLSAWSKVWLEESGVTIMRPELSTDDSGIITAFTILQQPRLGDESLKPHRLKVGGYSLRGTGQDARLERVLSTELDVSGAHTEVPDWVGEPRPDLILINDEDLSYAKVRLDEESLSTAHAHIEKLTDTHARTLVLGATWDMVRDGEAPASTYIDLVLRSVHLEKQSSALRVILGNLLTAVRGYTAPQAREQVRTQVADRLIELTAQAAPGSDEQLQLSRAAAAHASSQNQIAAVRGWLEGQDVPEGLVIDTGQRWVLVQALAAAGVADAAQIDAELARDDTSQGRLEAAHARAARPSAADKADAFAALTTDESLSNSTVEAMLLGFANARDLSAVAPLVSQYFAWLDEVKVQPTGEIVRKLADGLFPVLLAGDVPGADVDVLGSARSWLADNESAPAGLRRLVSEGLDDATRVARAQQVDAAAR